MLNRTGNAASLAQYACDRHTQQYGLGLEDKLDNLPTEAEARLTGFAYGSVMLTGQEPAVGNTVTVTITPNGGSPVALLVTAVSGDTRQTLADKLATATAANATLKAANVVAYSVKAYGLSGPEITWTAPASFTISTSISGNVGAPITASGSQLDPSAIVGKSQGQPVVKYGYLPILNHLEGAHAGTTQNQDTASADVWRGRGDELEQRARLYKEWREKLSGFLGVPLMPGSSSYSSLSVI